MNILLFKGIKIIKTILKVLPYSYRRHNKNVEFSFENGNHKQENEAVADLPLDELTVSGELWASCRSLSILIL